MLSPRGQNEPRSQNFERGLKDLASALKLWPLPRSQTFGLSLALISLSYYVIVHFSGKNRLKFVNFVNISGNNLKSYVVNHYLVLFRNYFGLGLGLNLQKLASASKMWPQPRGFGLINITANMTDRRRNVYEPVEILQQSTSSST